MRSFIATYRSWLCWHPSSTGNESDPRCGRRFPPRREYRTGVGGFRKPHSVRRDLTGATILLALLAVLLPATPAMADGRVFGPLPPRERALQIDAALLSPQRAPQFDLAGSATPQGPALQSERSAGRSYVVQPGDTLSQIAARFQLNPVALASRNGLTNPDHIEVGQSLKLDVTGASSPPISWDQGFRSGGEGDLLRVQVWPWPPVQGKTLAVWLETRNPVALDLGLDGSPYPVMLQGRRGWALVPIPALTAPGPHLLAVSAGSTSVTITLPVEAGRFELYHIPAAVSRPILDQAKKVQAEAAQLRALTGSRSPSNWTPRSRFSSPLAGEYPRSSPFGSRRTYEPNPAVSAHEGEDFSAPAGTAVTAPASGTVVLAEPLFVRGNAVVVDHGNGVFTGYWHLQELAVRRGDRVEPGQLLGRVGSTGLSTGAHLHWELRVNGVAVDPLQWLEK
jgi:murein DD-endopeptidase MepM/ murein hydrolase activator NlpD